MPYGLEIKDAINFVAGVVVATALSYVFYRLGRHKTELAYAVVEHQLIFKDADYPSDLKVTFAGEELDALNRATIFIWNSGNQAITDGDLDTKAPLRIKMVGGSKLLQISLAGTSREANNARLVKDRIEFDYLNPGDGLKLEAFLVHNEAKGKRYWPSITLNGEIIGMQNGLRTGAAADRRDFFWPTMATLIGLGLFFASWNLIYPLISWPTLSLWERIGAITGGTLTGLLGLGCIIFSFTLIFTAYVPRSLVTEEDRFQDMRRMQRMMRNL